MNPETPINKQDLEKPPLEHGPEEILNRHEISQKIDEAKKFLKIEYDIDELSTIEGVRLRHLVEQCIREAKKNRDEIKGLEKQIGEQEKEKGTADPDLLARIHSRGLLEFDNPAHEAAARWLLELYDINIDDVPICDLIKDETSGKNYKFFYPPELRSRQIHAIIQPEGQATRQFDAWEKFLRNREVELKGKAKELKRLGHKVVVEEGIVVPEFKEYLRRLREKSHKP